MSRRHHGRPHYHAGSGGDRARRAATSTPPASVTPPGQPGTDRPSATPNPQVPSRPQPDPTPNGRPAEPPAGLQATESMPQSVTETVSPAPASEPPRHEPSAPINGQRGDARPAHTNGSAPINGSPAAGAAPSQVNGGGNGNGQCTAPQLRRFIKSRPYVPMHELRRRFGIVGPDDDVTAVRLDPGLVYVGLPPREGSLLGELLRAGEIGYELSLDPRTPIVIGVYPMRPIPRS